MNTFNPTCPQCGRFPTQLGEPSAPIIPSENNTLACNDCGTVSIWHEYRWCVATPDEIDMMIEIWENPDGSPNQLVEFMFENQASLLQRTADKDRLREIVKRRLGDHCPQIVADALVDDLRAAGFHTHTDYYPDSTPRRTR